MTPAKFSRLIALLLPALASVPMLVTLSAPVSAAQWYDGIEGCLFSEDRDHRGDDFVVEGGWEYSYVGDDWNDEISSILCTALCEATIFEMRNFGGASRTYNRVAHFGNNGWNDNITSLYVECEE